MELPAQGLTKPDKAASDQRTQQLLQIKILKSLCHSPTHGFRKQKQ